MINVVNQYNTQYFKEQLGVFLTKNKTITLEDDKLFYEMNKKRPFADIMPYGILVTHDYDDYFEGDIITAFDILVKHRFKNSEQHAINYLIMKMTPKNIAYVRVGTDYFKKKTYMDDDGNVMYEKLIPWIKSEIKEDNEKEIFNHILKFDEFCIEPNNINYQRVHDGNYNNYHQIFHHSKPFDIDKDMDKIHWSMHMMNHIYGIQIDMGLDYMKVLWEHPKQILPILVLASELRQTGKTTYANWLEMIYKLNLVSIGVSDMKSDFNSHISEKLIIVIEETVSESHSLVNKIKMISTAKRMLVNRKNITQYVVDFYGKIIVMTNKPDKFLQIDEEEIRFWVREVPKITIENHNIEADLQKELPYFLYYLEQRRAVDLSKSRMVFTPDELGTAALAKVKRESKSALQKDIEEYLDQYALEHTDKKDIQFIAIDVKKKFFNHDSKINVSRVSRTLKIDMKLKQNGKNGRYFSILDENAVPGVKSGNGNYFSYKNKYYNSTLDKIEDVDENGVPF